MSTTALTPTQPNALALAGQIANGHAARAAFGDYQSRRADNTLRRQRADLALFADFLDAAGIPDAPTAADLYSDPDAWRGVTWGLVEAWRNWSLQQGYSVGSINVRLSTVKQYAKLAAKAGALDASDLAMVRTVGGYSYTEGRRIDERREVTRKGSKKADAVFLTPAQVKALKKQPDTPQGRRDAVLLALLLDHGLRVSEVAEMDVTAVNLAAGELGPFYRPKTGQWDIHKLTPHSKKALKAYFDAGDAPAVGRLLRASFGANRLGSAGVSTRNLSGRVRYLGKLAGIDGLSAHDLRHTWASTAAKKQVPLDKMVRKGGWKSPVMAMRYLERSAVADDGVTLWED